MYIVSFAGVTSSAEAAESPRQLPFPRYEEVMGEIAGTSHDLETQANHTSYTRNHFQ